MTHSQHDKGIPTQISLSDNDALSNVRVRVSKIGTASPSSDLISLRKIVDATGQTSSGGEGVTWVHVPYTIPDVVKVFKYFLQRDSG
jgi:hypothetical protein